MGKGRWLRISRSRERVTRGRARSLLAIAVALLLVGGLALVWLPDAFSDAGDYTGQSPSPLTLPSAPNEMAWLSDVLGGGLGRRRSQSSQARSQRAASRLAYQGQSSAGALAVVRRKIPALLKAQAWRGPRLRAGERLQRYVNDSQAVVSEPNHREGLLTGGVPLLGRTPQGNKLPDDLTLTSAGSYLAPASAPARVLLPRSSSMALRFPDQGVSLRVASAASGRAQVVDNQAFYPNVLTDTDELARPVPVGAETSFVLRSAKSPRDIPIDVTVPSGGALAQTGGLVQITRAGKPVAELGLAMATDAQHVALPTSYSLRGHRVTLHVGGGSDVAYPILVDPTTDIYDLYGQGNNPDPETNGEPWKPAPPSPTLNTSDVAKALYAKGSTNTGTYYTSGQAAQFNRFARNTDTYIYRVDESNLSHSDFPNGAQSEWFGGIYDEKTQYWQPGIFYSAAAGGSWYGPYSTNGYAVGVNTGNFAGVSVQFCALSTCNPGTIDTGNDAVFGLLMTASGYETNQPSTAMGDAGIFSDDNFWPTLSVTSHSNPPPSGWVQDYSDQVTLHSDDKGLGMGAQAVTRSGISKTVYASCNGQYSSCPYSFDGTISYGTAYGSQQPEGINTYTASATDIVGNTDSSQNKTWTVKIDRTPPTASLSCKDAAGNSYSLGQWSNTSSVTCTASGSDPTNASNGSGGSGLATLQYRTQFDSGGWSGWTTIASGGTLTTSEEGETDVQVQATDNAGNTYTTTSQAIKLDSTPPASEFSGSLAGADGQIINGSNNYDMSVTATDPPPNGGPNSGVASLDVTIDGQEVAGSPFSNSGCTSNGCPASFSTPWTFGPSSPYWTDGDHTVNVTATDQAGNSSTDSVSFTLAHADSLASQTLASDGLGGLQINGGRGADSSGDGDQAGFSIANVGDVNGDGYDDYLVGAPGANYNGTDSGAAYLVLGGPNRGPVTLSNVNAALSDPNASFITFRGASSGDRAGYAVAAAGDVNGDGHPDLLIGAPGQVTGGVQTEGHVYVIFGGPSLQSLDLNNLNPGGEANGFAINGPLAQPSLPNTPPPVPFGASLATTRAGDVSYSGDLNGDDKSDIVIGASENSAGLPTNQGTVYVLYGKSDTGTIDLGLALGDPRSTSPPSGYRVTGANVNDLVGQSVAFVGDINGDGLDDVAVTAPGASYTDTGQTQPRSNAGSAYVVYGRTASPGSDPTVESLQGAGQGYAVYGATGSKLVNIASAGDVNGDGTPDLLLGGHGAWVVDGQNTGQDVDLAAPFNGYQISAPSSSADYDNAIVSTVGDIDSDNAPDHLVAFPAANGGSGTGYLIYGQPVPGNIDLSQPLAGDKGTTVSGSNGEAAGQSSDGSDYGNDGQPAALVGAPNANSGAGRVTTFRESDLADYQHAAAASSRRGPCAPVNGPFTFPYQSGKPLPLCRRAPHGFTDIPLGTEGPGGGKHPYNPKVPTCGEPTPTCGPSAYAGGNVRVHATALKNDPTTGRFIPIVDSFGHTFAFLTQSYPGCYTVSAATNDTTPGAKQGDTTPGGDVNPTADHCKDTSVNPRAGTNYVYLEMVGRACMADPAQEEQYWFARIHTQNQAINEAFAGLQGFIPRGDLVYNSSRDDNLEHALPRSGCNDHLRPSQLQNGAALDLSHTGTFGNGATGPDNYLSPAAYTRCYTTRTCGGPYANYQGPNFQANMAGLAMGTYSSTAVSGSRYGGSDRAEGGYVSSVVPRTHAFTVYSEIPYCDPNVPAGAAPVAQWVFGDANPTPSSGQNHLYGWYALRPAGTPGAPSNCGS